MFKHDNAAITAVVVKVEVADEVAEVDAVVVAEDVWVVDGVGDSVGSDDVGERVGEMVGSDDVGA
jgi:hypothetical protein